MVPEIATTPCPYCKHRHLFVRPRTATTTEVRCDYCDTPFELCIGPAPWRPRARPIPATPLPRDRQLELPLSPPDNPGS